MAAVASPMAVNGNGAAGSPAPAGTDSKEKENYVEGMIYPPPDIRSIVDKTASFIAKHANPAAFEDKIRQREKTDSKFSFLNEADAYHAYYQHRIKQFKDGTAGALAGAPAAAPAGADALTTASRAIAGAAGEMVDEGRPTVPQPRPFEFINTEKPPMAPVDADILRLTALFTARMGRGFTSDLSSRESGNYQFDFLRPSHSLFGYFNRLVEQYTKVLMAPKETLDILERQSGHTEEYDPLLTTEDKRRAIGRREIMQGVENRVEWQKYDNARRQAEDTAAEEERIAFATIDWQDFIVVSTVDFTDQDELLDLPPPMSRSEVENMTLAQKRMAAMIMEGKDVATAAVESGAVSKEADDAEMEMSGDEADELVKRVEQTSKAPQEAKLAVGANGPIKIRKDYVPKSQRAKKVVTTACRVCGQQIPESEMAEHVRIELLDPRWKEKQMEADSKRSASNMLLAGTDVASSLRSIAAKRTDIFTVTQEDEARRRAKEEEERIRKREREKVVWDGHTASAISTAERFQTGANLDEQIAALHRAKGLTAMESNIGPKLGESGEGGANSGPAPNFFSAPGSFSGATLSAAANPSAQSQQPDPAQMQQQQQQPQYTCNAYQQQGYPGYPQQQAQYGYDPNQQYQQQQQMMQQQQYQQQYQAGQARPAEQSEEANKRQKQ